MNTLKILFRYRVIHIVLAVVLLDVCFFSHQTNYTKPELDKASKVFAAQFPAFGKETDSVLQHLRKNTSWYKSFSKDNYIDYLFGLPYTVLKYRHDTLTFWNNNLVNTTPQTFNFLNEYSLLKLKNGYYLARRRTDDGNAYVFVLPVKLEYNTTNEYLHSGYSLRFNIDDNVALSLTPVPNSESVSLPGNSGVFYISYNASPGTASAGVLFYLAYIIAILLLFEFIIELSKRLFKPAGSYKGLFYLVLIVTTYLLRNQPWVVPKYFSGWLLFNPNYYASPYVAKSLGILIIEAFIFFYLSVKFYQETIYDRKSAAARNVDRVIIHTLLTYLFGYLAYCVVQSLIIDSNISFEFFNPYNPDYYNLLCFLTIGMVITGYCLLAQKLIRIVTDKPVKSALYAYLFTTAVISFIVYLLANDNFTLFFLLLLTNAFVGIMALLRIRNIFNASISSIFILLIYFAALTSVFIRHYNKEKEISFRLSYAKKLTNERDNETEYLLGEIRNPILSDPIVFEFFTEPRKTNSKVIDRLNKNYFHTGFNRFDVKYYFYDAKGQPIPTPLEETLVKNEQLISNSEVCDEHELYFISEPSGNFIYVSEYPIKKGDVTIGTLMVQLASKVYSPVNVYPELLLEEKNKLPLSNYSFCIYNNKIMAQHEGDYSYPNYNVFSKDSLADNDYYLTVLDDYSHLVFKRDKNKVVVVSLSNNQRDRYLSNFSYVFTVLFLWTALLALVLNINYLFIQRPRFGFISNASFRAFIQFSFLVIILSAVIIIGVFTAQFFIRQFNYNTENRLNDKLEMVVESADFLTALKQPGHLSTPSETYLVNLLRENVEALSAPEDIDINFYNPQGDLIATSQPAIFEKGFISKKMNPVAYYRLTSESLSRMVQNEKIGSLTFFSGYQPLLGKDGSVIAYLNIPYFNTSKDLNEQIGIFFASLVSIVVITLIIAGLLAPLISKTITRRLSIIADKFKQVTLGRKNEPIEWHTKDEVGSLVNEFNKMILKLDKNAELLARSERESAWREMAKQVAHEIKNPLTPMKLSIQHLQRAYQSDAPNKDELAKKVAATLIEQIDNLSKIANEFSSFAKMPVSEMQNISLHEVLKSSFDLFKENESVELSYSPTLEDVHIVADKNQLLRVFNNLILNAIQSIPESRDGKVEVNTSSTDRFVKVEITDNGKGINEEDIDSVFVPNFTTKSSGTGLGLAISKNIIESFGGKIGFSTSPNEGTTFYVELPRARN